MKNENHAYCYILDPNRLPIPVFDLMEWARWMEVNDRTVCRDVFEGVLVSTVFLGVDHAFSGGEPVLFETMTFFRDEPGINSQMYRYASFHEAKEGHESVLFKVKQEFESAGMLGGDCLTKIMNSKAENE